MQHRLLLTTKMKSCKSGILRATLTILVKETIFTQTKKGNGCVNFSGNVKKDNVNCCKGVKSSPNLVACKHV